MEGVAFQDALSQLWVSAQELQKDPANATNQTFEWIINSGAPVGTTIKTVSDDTKTVTIQAGAVSGSITIEATAKDGGGANKLMHITVME